MLLADHLRHLAAKKRHTLGMKTYLKLLACLRDCLRVFGIDRMLQHRQRSQTVKSAAVEHAPAQGRGDPMCDRTFA